MKLYRKISVCFLVVALVAFLTACGDVKIDEENFPDDVFREYVSDNFDINGDGVLGKDETDAVTEINVNRNVGTYEGNFYYQAENTPIRSLQGIEHFTNLEILYCFGQELTFLDVTKNIALTELGCGDNQLTSLDVSKNIALKDLRCWRNQLTSLDVSRNTVLCLLACSDNQLASLDISKNSALQILECDGN